MYLQRMRSYCSQTEYVGNYMFVLSDKNIDMNLTIDYSLSFAEHLVVGRIDRPVLCFAWTMLIFLQWRLFKTRESRA